MRPAVIFGLALALTFASASSMAQDDPLAGKPVAQATPVEKKEASKTFKVAKQAFDDRRLDEALAGFRASYAVVASPNAQLMIAATLAELGRNAESYQLLDSVIANADAAAATNEKYKATAQSARDRQAETRAKVGFVTLVNHEKIGDASVTFNGREITSDRWSKAVAVDPGDLTIMITGQDARNHKIVAGEAIVVDMVPKPPEQPLDDIIIDDSPDEGPDKILIAIVAGGVAVGGFAMFGIFGGIALGNFSDLEDECGEDKKCTADLQGKADDGQTFQVVANVGLAIGIVGTLVAGGFLTWEFFFTDPPAEGGDDTTASLKLAPGAVMIDGTLLAIAAAPRGRFYVYSPDASYRGDCNAYWTCDRRGVRPGRACSQSQRWWRRRVVGGRRDGERRRSFCDQLDGWQRRRRRIRPVRCAGLRHRSALRDRQQRRRDLPAQRLHGCDVRADRRVHPRRRTKRRRDLQRHQLHGRCRLRSQRILRRHDLCSRCVHPVRHGVHRTRSVRVSVQWRRHLLEVQLRLAGVLPERLRRRHDGQRLLRLRG